jgi:hypothetical protein
MVLIATMIITIVAAHDPRPVEAVVALAAVVIIGVPIAAVVVIVAAEIRLAASGLARTAVVAGIAVLRHPLLPLIRTLLILWAQD